MEDQIEMDLGNKRRNWNPSTQGATLLYFLQDFRSGAYEKPLHQREKVWSDLKVKLWIDRISGKHNPKGQFLLYQIRGEPHKSFLNDGLQRTLASLRFMDNPKKFGYTETEAIDMLRNVTISVDYDVYDSHQEALRDFVGVNFGTPLTPYEMCRGELVLMPDFELIWSSKVDQVHEVVHSGVQRIAASFTRERKARHKFLRHNFSLFCKFVTKTTELSVPGSRYVGVGRIENLKDIYEKRVIERTFRDVLVSSGVDGVEKAISLFRNHIDRQTMDIQKCMLEVGDTPLDGVQEVAARWFYDVSMWKRATGISNPRWLDYIQKVLTLSQGTSTLISPDNTKYRVTIRTGRVASELLHTCEITGSDLYRGKEKRKRKQKKSKIGCHDDHILSFVDHGDGETQSIPASINLSMGAKRNEEKNNETLA